MGSCEVREETHHNRADLAVHKGDVLIAEYKDNKLINIMRCNIENREDKELFSFPMESGFSAHVSASDEYVACVDSDTKPETLKLYNRREKTIQTILLPRLTALIFNISFLRDGSLLATVDDGAGKFYLNKYRISSTKATDGEAAASLVWSCQLYKAGGIAVSADERLIFVSEPIAKRIYVLISNGWYYTYLSDTLNNNQKNLLNKHCCLQRIDFAFNCCDHSILHVVITSASLIHCTC